MPEWMYRCSLCSIFWWMEGDRMQVFCPQCGAHIYHGEKTDPRTIRYAGTIMVNVGAPAILPKKFICRGAEVMDA